MCAAEQLSFGGMPQKLYACTPTRLTSWLDCPRRYRMTYLDRPPPPKGAPWAHNSLGASVHNALAGWWRLPLPGRTVTAAGDLLQAGWIAQGFADERQSARQRARARAMVESYVATLDPADEPLGVERTVATRTDRIAVSGRIDRLDERLAAPAGGERGTELVVVDYKTGRHLLSTDDARSSLALALYAVAAARSLRRPCHRVELHHLPSGTRARLGAHRRHAGPAAAPGRGHRRRVRRGGRGLPRRPGARAVRRGVPAAARAGLRLVRLPAALRRGSRGQPRPPALGRHHGRGERPDPYSWRARASRPAARSRPSAAASAACQNALSALAVVSGASTAGEWRRGRDADPFGGQPRRHLLLRGRLPLVVVLAVQHEDGGLGRPGQLGRAVRGAEQVLAHDAQADGGVAQHPFPQEGHDLGRRRPRRRPGAPGWCPRCAGSCAA